MALKKYKLENLPKHGQVKMEQGTGRAIILDPETITDEQCESLVGDGKDATVNYYIKLVKDKPEPKDEVAKK